MMTNPFKAERDALVEAKATLRREVRDLRRALNQRQEKELTIRTLRETLYGLSERPAAPPKWINPPERQENAISVPILLASDWHFGEVVRKSEVGGLNTFNRKIGRERIQRMINIAIELCRKHMGPLVYPGMVFPLMGDMISGMIHEELRETNEGTVQECLYELEDLLAAAITRLADEFGKIFVPCVVGNHGRMKAKPHAKHRVFENFEWSLYNNLERHFRNDSRVQFYIPEGPDVFFNVLGHRFMETHGDAMGVKGGDGIIGAIGPIARGAVKVGRSEAAVGRDFDTLIIGHWHTYIPRGEAFPVIVNGTLKGFDEFAHTLLRVPYSRPSQALFFVHQEHGITAQWQVFLDGRQKAAPAKDWLRFDGGDKWQRN